VGQVADCALTDSDHLLEDPAGFYRCQEDRLNQGEGCGPEGYPLGYAGKYAEIYMWEVYPEVGPEAQAFLEQNLLCLQSAFLEDTTTEMTCDEVAAAGFAAHPVCYLASGICGVPVEDQLAILFAVASEDMGLPGQAEAITEIAGLCAQ
jgi:hypothetical protein